VKYLFDTNVISEFVSARPNERVIAWIDAVDPDSVYLSVVTIGELAKGIAKLSESVRKTALHRWLTEDLLIRFEDRILALNVPVMLAWGELTGRLERSGRPLPAMDSLIAAVALYHQCTLVTRNDVDFRDTGVPVLNPWL
jgi:tRNA(fMet)-specific endonuclease VapC